MIGVTKPPNNYITPKNFEVEECKKVFKIPDNNPKMNLNLQDLSNLYARGTFIDIENLNESIMPEINKQIGWKPNPEGFWLITSRGLRFKSRSEAIKNLKEYICPEVETRIQGLRKLKLEKVPGDSPLERACFLTKMLKDKTIDSEVAEEINQKLEKLDKLDKEDIELLQQEEKEEEVKTEEGSTDPSTEKPKSLNLKKLEIAEDMVENPRTEIWCNISKLLEHSSHFLSFRETEIKPDVEGEEIRIRPIVSVDEMEKLSAHEWALPESLLYYQVASQTATVREHITRIEKKQLLYLLVDSSGSMSSKNRLYKAGGVVMNRLKAVVKGDAVCYLKFFAGELESDRHYACDEKTAKELMNFVRDHNFDGGETYIDNAILGCVTDINELMEKEKLLVRPELVIITDGGGSIGITSDELGQTKLHAILFDYENSDLINLAKTSGGVSVKL